MNKKVLDYAKKNIDIIAKENNINCYISDGNLYIELISGRNFKLSEDEVYYQAEEYLKQKIESLRVI